MGYNFNERNERKNWYKEEVNHYKENMNKKFKVKNISWEPGNQYIGKTGKCVSAWTSYSNSDVKFIELNIAPGIAFDLKDLEKGN